MRSVLVCATETGTTSRMMNKGFESKIVRPASHKATSHCCCWIWDFWTFDLKPQEPEYAPPHVCVQRFGTHVAPASLTQAPVRSGPIKDRGNTPSYRMRYELAAVCCHGTRVMWYNRRERWHGGNVMNTTATPATPEARDVLDRALKLSAPEREVIARRLMDSVAPPPGVYESEDALRAELLRRIEDIESGRVKPITPEEMFANVRKALDEARNT
ncbi:hypothetical protein C1280_31900 [Gemmata obscuriglobus]|uniref:Addiction module antitoxin RelB n=2 Tax=Gemmata obscuriglobus TaxID=114 RepID=A0A2Z3H8C9_9BACT|nr:hypothetical protein C1280_31900 [Gemmata obscuriglobus]